MRRELFLTALVVTSIIPAAVAALVDWRAHRVPDSLVILTLAPVVLAVVVADEPTRRLVAVAAGAGLMALPLLLVHVVAPAAMGFGDVKLALALGAALGVIAPELTVPALAAGAGTTLLVASCTRRVAMPFAPGLVAGAATALAFGPLEGWKVA